MPKTKDDNRTPIPWAFGGLIKIKKDGAGQAESTLSVQTTVESVCMQIPLEASFDDVMKFMMENTQVSRNGEVIFEMTNINIPSSGLYLEPFWTFDEGDKIIVKTKGPANFRPMFWFRGTYLGFIKRGINYNARYSSI